jgi:hypothetical protein
MCDGRPVHADVVLVAELQELSASKLGPVVGDDGIPYPNRWMMSVKNDTACSALRFVIGSASIHLENLSMETSRWV